MRSASSPAALRVKVSPRIWSGLAWPLASSQSTRFAIVSVLPLPAPATTRVGASGASITACCSAVGGNIFSASAIWRAEIWTAELWRAEFWRAEFGAAERGGFMS